MIRTFPSSFKGFTPNKTILLLTCIDIFTWGFVSIISVFSGVYLSNKLDTDVAQMVGIGIALYYLVRALIQIPLGMLLDKIQYDRDEIVTLILGVLLMGTPFILYPAISQPVHYYVLQIILGMGVSMHLVSWRKLFNANLEKKKEGFAFGFYETFMSLATSFFSIIAGIIANLGDDYFDWVMRILGSMIILSGFLVAYLFKIKDRHWDI